MKPKVNVVTLCKTVKFVVIVVVMFWKFSVTC